MTDLAIGENIFVWTVDNGPCATMDANTAAIPGLGTWTLTQGAATIVDMHDPNTEITDLGIGENILTWTIYNGPCAGSGSSDSIVITVFDRDQADANAGEDQALCSPQKATMLTANAAAEPATGFWTLVEGSGNIINPSDPNSAFTNIGLGENVLVWTIENGACENALTTDTVVISLFAFDAAIADAGSNQEFCLPQTSTSLEGNSAGGASQGTWTLVSGSATIAEPNNPLSAITDLGVGNNIFQWTIDNGPCGESLDTVTISVFDPEAPQAAAGEDQFFCTPISTTTLNANTPATPGVGTWQLVSGMGTIANPNNPNTALSGLTIGENVFCWTIYNGPCAEPTTDCVSIFIYDENHPTANAGEDQELCLPQASTQLQASPAIFPAFGTWELLEGSGTIAEPNNPNTIVSGLSLGVNTFVWTLTNEPCDAGNTSDTVTILVFEEDIEPAFAGEDQSLCSPIAETTLTANPLAAPNSGTWQLIAGNGAIDEPFNHETNVSGLTVGENTFVWTVYNGSCDFALSSDTVSIFIFDQQQAVASAGNDQELCLPSSSTLLQGNAPIFPATGEWTLVSGSGSILNPNDPNSAVTGLELGINTFMWSIANGVCEGANSEDLVNIVVFSEDAASANAGEDIEICTPQGSVTLQAQTPDVPTTGTWSVIQGNGTISDVNDPNAVYSAFGVGEHILQWSIYNGPCEQNNSFDFVNITVYDGTAPAIDAGQNQQLCAPESSTVMNAQTPLFPAHGTWSIVSGSGSIADVNDPNTEINDLTIGVTVLQWTVYNGPCGEPEQALVTITIYNPDSPDADAGEDQHFCTPFGGTTLDGNLPMSPASGTWSLISGSAEITNANVANTTVFNLGLGENIFVWSIDNGPCANGTTSDTVSVFINDIGVAAANAGPDQELCGSPFELQLQGSTTIGNTAIGEWTIVSGGADFENVNNEATYISNLQHGENVFMWTVDNGICGVSSDEVTITIFDPELPPTFAGTDLEICGDDFVIFNLPGSDVDPPAMGTWTIIEGPMEIGDPNDPNATVWSLGEIFTPLVPLSSTIIWTVDNGPCGTSADTATYTLLDCLTIEVPNAFSPNGDGINDFYEIPNLYKYPNNSIKIFNRWGVEVFQASPYKNDWDGRSRHPATIGEELPVSTYYYILDLGEPSIKPFNGFIYLKR